MRIILTRLVGEAGTVFTQMEKEIHSELIPAQGMAIDDQAWKQPVEIEKVVCYLQENYYHVELPPLKFESQDVSERHIQMMESHGWRK